MQPHRKWWACALAVTLLISGCASLQNGSLGDLLGDGTGGALDEKTVAAGIREALRVGAGRAVDTTSMVDGFLADELIRIAIPDQLTTVTSTLRDLGLDGPVDELENGMNRAAELAAGEARGVLWDAVASLTIGDAFAILEGGESAATDLFRERTADELRGRFKPIVAASMDEVGLAQLFGRVIDIYDAIPLTDKPEIVDLEDHVTTGALDGLFTVLAREEREIRTDPLARTTELLRRVFGR